MKKNNLLFWIVIIIVILSAIGYVRLYFLYAEGIVTTPNLPAVAHVVLPVKVENKVFGYSVQNKPIEGYEIGNGQDVILLIGAIHGNEVGTAELLNQLVAEIKLNPKIIPNNKKIIIIPVTNPDGFTISQKFNANGVNLNLNFDTPGWKNYGPQGTYAGTKPFSEPESLTIKQVIEKYKPQMMISFHSQGAIVNPEEDAQSDALGEWYAQKTGYTYSDSADLGWDFFGTATGWFAQNYNKPAITVEITSHTESDWDINKPALIELVSSNNLTATQ